MSEVCAVGATITLNLLTELNFTDWVLKRFLK